MHSVAVVALPHTIGLDLATPVGVFGRVVLADGAPGYEVRVCAASPEVAAGPFRIAVDHGLDILADADTIVVPAREDPTVPEQPEVLDALRAAEARGTRIASICAGAFTLAAAGILDGRRATTHWVAAELFRDMYPNVDLDPDVLYVDDGQVLTSAGATAGIDLCLHIVERDYGAAVAADAARLAVAPLHRSGGQAQFIVRNQQQTGPELHDLLGWIERHAHRDLTLGDIAAEAAVSMRTLNRRFQAETGQTPMQWLTGVRVRQAQVLLEATTDSVELIGRRAGFASPANFREQFRRVAGVAPQAYRATFRGQDRSA